MLDRFYIEITFNISADIISSSSDYVVSVSK